MPLDGEDAALRRVAAAFRASLPSTGSITVFPIDPLDRLGFPVVQANLIEPGKPATIGYGYGTRLIEAEVGALGELCEEVHVGAHLARAPLRRDTERGLVARHGRAGVIDPLTLCLPAGSPYTDQMPLTWIQAVRYPSRQPVWVPREWVAAYTYQLEEQPVLITPITNGLGAGLDEAHAIGHGVMELLQRDGNVLSYRALDQGVAITLDDAVPADLRALLSRFEAAGLQPIVKFAATDFGLCNLYVVGDDTASAPAITPIQITACGEACHPDRARALRKALLEFAGSRSRKVATHGPLETVRPVLPPDYLRAQIEIALLDEESRALTAMAEWVVQDTTTLRARLAPRVFATHHHRPFSALPTVAPEAVAASRDRLQLLADRLATEDLEILWVDASPPGAEVRVVKVIVPGLECETMSYHRLGWRGVRRLRDRADPLLHATPAQGAARVRLRPEDEARAGGPAWFDTQAADALVGPLYPLYRECGPFAAQLRAGRV